MAPDFHDVDLSESILDAGRKRGMRHCRHCLARVSEKAAACPVCGCPVDGQPPTLGELEAIKARGPINLRECPECLSDVSVRATACTACGEKLTPRKES